jgi:hypothetical protein
MKATFQRISKWFWWTGIRQSVEEFVKQCTVCQQAKHEHCRTPGLLNPLPIPEQAWQDLSMDFIDCLPKCEGYSVILVVVDHLTKYAHFIALKHPYTAQSVALAFFNNVVKLHGLPKTIVSDRDKVFTGTIWKELFRLLDTKLCLSSAYHAQTDGQTDRINQCLEGYLRCAVSSTPKHWLKWLPLAELWYNSSFHSSLQCSPFKALYGTDPSFGIAPMLDSTDNASVQATLHERQQFLELLKQNLSRAQIKMKANADNRRTERSFQVGELVWLKLQPYAQSSVVNRPCPKLAMKSFGPYKIIEKIGSAAYKLELPANSLVHPVFHVSQLKSYTADYSPVFKPLSELPQLNLVDLKPERILEHRLSKKGNSAITQVLVKWSNLPDEMATWEDFHVLQTQFPDATA